MTFHLYDEQLGKVVEFEPIIPGQVSIYHCGLTVQAPPHLGHIRKEIVFDVLRRWLEGCGLKVKVVANVTDIDDKIIAKSAEQGIEWYELAYAMELELHRAYTALGCRPPDYEPRATGHIPEQIELIQRLLERGHAYVADDGSANVYFDVRSWPQYGGLSHQKISEMVNDEGADNKGKRDARDFALWKGHKEDEPETASWPSPWGRGRPGWHLECSAMSLKYLGAEFDIHGGGMDLKFPHHENELAQSRAAGFGFAKYWMHNAFVTAAGEKMSKSLGNYARVTEVTKQYPARAVRLYLAQTHYRSVIEFSDTSLEEATARLSRIDGFLERAGISGAPQFRFEDLPEEFVKAMDDDLSTPAAVAVIYETVKAGNKALDSGHDASEQLKALRAMLHILGLDPLAPEWENSASGPDHTEIIDGLVKLVLDQRTAARERKDWANADAIRDTLTQLGIKVEDTPAGARWQIGG